MIKVIKHYDETSLIAHTQPSLLLCPHGHVMDVQGRGTLEQTAICITPECALYRVFFKIELTPVVIRRVNVDMKQEKPKPQTQGGVPTYVQGETMEQLLNRCKTTEDRLLQAERDIAQLKADVMQLRANTDTPTTSDF